MEVQLIIGTMIQNPAELSRSVRLAEEQIARVCTTVDNQAAAITSLTYSIASLQSCPGAVASPLPVQQEPKQAKGTTTLPVKTTLESSANGTRDEGAGEGTRVTAKRKREDHIVAA